MANCCPEAPSSSALIDSKYRKVLWIALFINAIMFCIELAGGFAANSVSLLADAVDFLGDAANYGLSLFVLALAPVWRSRTAMIKGITMGSYGIFVIGKAAWNAFTNEIPEPAIMSLIALLALIANGCVTFMLYAYRKGDANMRSVWLCTRNDMIANLAVLFAALGVFGTSQAWPDLAVAGIMGILSLTAAYSVIKHARQELNQVKRCSSLSPKID